MTEHSLRVTLPLPPSQNHSYRRHTTNTGRRMNVLTSRAAKWQADARDRAYQAMCDSGWTCPQAEKVIVELTVWWPDRRRRDAQNLLKLLCDALEGSAVDDDRYMLVRVMDYGYCKDDPRVEVTVRRAGA